MSTAARDLRIVALAQARTRPGEIARRLGCSADVVYVAIRAARLAGCDIPHFSSGRAADVGGPRPRVAVLPVVASEAFREPEIVRPIPAPAPATGWTAADDRRLSDLDGRRIGLTAIAATMRKPYREVIAAAERLGLYARRQRERVAL